MRAAWVGFGAHRPGMLLEGKCNLREGTKLCHTSTVFARVLLAEI